MDKEQVEAVDDLRNSNLRTLSLDSLSQKDVLEGYNDEPDDPELQAEPIDEDKTRADAARIRLINHPGLLWAVSNFNKIFFFSAITDNQATYDLELPSTDLGLTTTMETNVEYWAKIRLSSVRHLQSETKYKENYQSLAGERIGTIKHVMIHTFLFLHAGRQCHL